MNKWALKDQIFFAKRLAFLMQAGVPLVDGLMLIRSQTKSGRTVRIFDAIVADVSAGMRLATALGRFRRLFGDFAISLVRIGEESGTLSLNLAHLSEELAKKQQLRRKVIGALLYPLLLSIATLGMTAALVSYIFPKLLPIFSSLNVELPATTRTLIATAAFMHQWGVVLIAGIIFVGIAFLIAWQRNEWLRYWCDTLVVQTPLLGALARSYALANSSRALALLLRSQVPLVDALRMCAYSQTNLCYREALLHLAEKSTAGGNLADGFAARSDLFPDVMAHLIAVGERTGNLEESLHYLASLYEGEVDELTKSLSSAVEPVVMLTMGGLVALVAISVITPIYDLTAHLQTK